MDFNRAKEIMFEKLGTHKIMAIASSVNDKVMIRNISAVIIDEKIYFKTDKNFIKTKQILENDNVALCFHGVSFEGKAINKGLVVDDKELMFQDKYQEYWDKSYNAYQHESNEILFEVTPHNAEIWGQDENYYAFQIMIDFIKKEVLTNKYD